MPDLTDELNKLAALRNRGVISEGEFNAKKAQLFDTEADMNRPETNTADPAAANRPAGIDEESSRGAMVSPKSSFLKTPKGKMIATLGALGTALVVISAMSGAGHKTSSSSITPVASIGSSDTQNSYQLDAAAVAAPSGGLDEETVRRLILASYGNADGQGYSYSINWKSVQFAPSRSISDGESGQTAIPFGTTVTPVHVLFDRIQTSSDSQLSDPNELYLLFYKDDYGNWAYRPIAHN